MKEHRNLAAGALQERQHLVGLSSLWGVILEVAYRRWRWSWSYCPRPKLDARFLWWRWLWAPDSIFKGWCFHSSLERLVSLTRWLHPFRLMKSRVWDITGCWRRRVTVGLGRGALGQHRWRIARGRTVIVWGWNQFLGWLFFWLLIVRLFLVKVVELGVRTRWPLPCCELGLNTWLWRRVHPTWALSTDQLSHRRLWCWCDQRPSSDWINSDFRVTSYPWT